MTKPRSLVQNILIWTYERGTLQYDIICILILAFIFFIPPSCFHRRMQAEIQPQGGASAFPASSETSSSHQDLLNEKK